MSMTPEHHRNRAERIGRSLAKLRESDPEIRIEAAMLAGTHWVHYVLHKAGVSGVTEDMVHASMCTVSVLRKYRLAETELVAQLEEIEELRPLYVRGDMDEGARAANRALELLSSIEERARNLS